MKSSVRVLVVLIAFCGLAAWADSDSKMLAQESTPVLGTPVPDQPIETGANQWYVNDTQMTFAALGYYDRTVTSPEAMLDLYLPLSPGTFPVDYTGLVLNISHSPLLDPDVSTMTVYANDTALTSVFLDESNQAGSALEVALPVGSVGIDGYEIRIEFSLRLTGESCEPVANQALWATVHGDSMFDATRRHDEGTADLSTISDQFVDLAEPITIVLPAAPTAAEFETAGVVAFQIGRWNANDADFPSIVYASVADGLVTGPSIYLGTGSGLADPRSWTGLIWDGSNYSKDGETVNPDHGVLALVQDPNPVLHVSGMTDLALARSVAMLTKDAAAATLRGPLVFATDQVSLEGEGPTAWTGSETTFGDLGIDEQEVRGAGDHTLDLVVRRPSEWIAGNGGNLTVNVLASPSVVPELSSIGVSVNGVRIGSSALTEGVEPGSIVFDLPAEAINAKPGGQLDVRIEVHLELLSGSCRAADPDSAWLRVVPDSSWSIPHASYPDLDLARLPAPFSGQSDTSPFLIVLPDSPSLSDVTAGLHVATAFGQRTGHVEGGVPRFIPAGVVTDELRATHSIVLIGSSETNSLLSTLIQQDVTASRFSQSDASEIVTLAMMPSPWLADGTVLTIVPGLQGTTESIARLFGDPSTMDALSGIVVTVDPVLLPETKQLPVPAVQPPDATPSPVESAVPLTTTQPTQTPSSAIVSSVPVAPTFRDEDITEGWPVASILLVGGFLAAIGTFLWIRSRQPLSGSGTASDET